MFPTATAEFLADLAAAVGADHVLDQPYQLMAYAYDATGEKYMPTAVAFPGNAAEVAVCVRACHRHGIPLVPRGAGTNLSGGTLPVHGGLVLQFRRMQQVLAIDVAGRRAVVEPGCTNLALQQALAPYGLCFAPDPASQKVSTLGGNIAENSGGPHCLKYGVTSSHVLGLELVLADGRVVTVGSDLEDHPDHDVSGLICGSEGTLAVVTQATVRLTPLPRGYATLLAVFGDVDASGRAVSAVIAARIIPAAMELVDGPTIGVLRESGFTVYPEGAQAALVIEVDGDPPDLPAEQAHIAAICREHGALQVLAASSEAERSQLWLGRRSVAGAYARLSPSFWVQDVTVPRDRLPEMIRAVNEIGARFGVRITTVAHAGDGNLHPTIPFFPSEPEQMALIRQVDAEIIRACLRLGGSITGEHGVGIDKLPGMAQMFTPTELTYMQRVRRALDPDGLLNPGKLLPDEQGGLGPGDDCTLATGPVANGLPTAPAGADSDVSPGIGRPPCPPVVTLRPTDPDAAAAAVAAVRRDGLAVAISGSGSHRSWRPGPAADYAWLRLDGLVGAVEINPDNLSATFLSGTPVGAVQAALAQHGLWWPVDAPPQRSLGGVVAAGARYPGRTGYGPVREWVLALEVLTDSGERMVLGRPTMKNVAGYDLVKLHIGARGTLGPLLTVTLRLLPAPEQQVTLALDWPSAATAGLTLTPGQSVRDLAAAAEWLAISPAQVDGLGASQRLVLRLDGRAAALERRVAAIQSILPDARILTDATPAWSEWHAWREQAVAALGPHWVRMRVAVPPARGLALPQLLAAALRSVPWQAIGPVWLGLATVWTHSADGAAHLAALAQQAAARGGTAWLEAAPAGVALPVTPSADSGPTPAQTVRAALAPNLCYNPHL